MLNALWLVPLVLLLARGYSDPESSPLDTAFYFRLDRVVPGLGIVCAVRGLPIVAESVQAAPFVSSRYALRRASAAGNDRLLCRFPAGRRGISVDAGGARCGCGDTRLRPGHVPLCGTALRSPFSLPDEGWTRGLRPHETGQLDWIYALGVGGALVFLSDILAGSVAYQDLWI